uniref:Uncharacterized protein n=1 Tax=Arundo donax TaxID=35708 RepID=A0A0A9HWB5_ARUDO
MDPFLNCINSKLLLQNRMKIHIIQVNALLLYELRENLKQAKCLFSSQQTKMNLF